MTSPWSEIAGLPISLFAIPTYAVMIYRPTGVSLSDSTRKDVGAYPRHYEHCLSGSDRTSVLCLFGIFVLRLGV